MQTALKEVNFISLNPFYLTLLGYFNNKKKENAPGKKSKFLWQTVRLILVGFKESFEENKVKNGQLNHRTN